MAIMSDYEPDPQTAKLFARYKQAAKVIKDDKKPVLEAAEQAIRQGATSPELAAMTGMSGQTFRTLAEKIGVDIRTKPPTVGREAEARRASAPRPEQPSALATHQAKLVAALTDDQAAQLVTRAYGNADRRQYSELNEASTGGDRAVISAGLACGALNETDLRLA